MISSVLMCQLAFFALFALCAARPSLFDTDEEAFLQEAAKAKRFFLPYEMSSGAVLGALRAHERARSLLNADADFLEQKRTTANLGILERLPVQSGDETDPETRNIKRKMFWQPLGYLPASVRAHNVPSGNTETGSQGSGPNVFRYGKK